MGTTWLVISIFLSFVFPVFSGNFAVYYGKNEVDYLKTFKLVIIQPSHYDKQQIERIKNSGTKVIAYFSIGEIEKILKYKNGKIIPIYLDRNKDGKPDKNKNWNSYFINPWSDEWKNYSNEKIKKIFSNGFDGLFLDTIDTVDIYPELKENFVSYIKWLRDCFPSKILIVNRGFSIIKEISPYIDGVLFECFSTHYNFKNKRYERWKGNDLKWTENIMKKLKEMKLKIYILDYSKKEDIKLIEFIEKRAEKFGCPVYVSEIHLDKIFYKK